MPIRDPRRGMIFAVLAAIVFGVMFGWCVRVYTSPERESRGRKVLEVIRERVREFTR